MFPLGIFIFNPLIDVERDYKNGSIIHKSLGVKLTCSDTLKKLLASLEGKKHFTIASIKRTYGLSDGVLKYLLDYLLIVPKENSEAVCRGLHYYTKHTLKNRVTLGNLICENKKKIVIVGCPFDSPKGYLLSSVTTPENIRLNLPNCNKNIFADMGDVIYHPHNESMEIVGKRIDYLVEVISKNNHIPLFLGGDHSISYYTLSALAKVYGKVTLIVFDAHHDLYIDELSINSLTHANVIYHIAMSQLTENIIQVGLRCTKPISTLPNTSVLYCNDTHMNSFKALVDRISDSSPCYISIDIDVLDPLIAPDVVAPIKEGLTLNFLNNAINHLKKNKNIVGYDIVEACSTGNNYASTIKVACSVLLEIGKKL